MRPSVGAALTAAWLLSSCAMQQPDTPKAAAPAVHETRIELTSGNVEMAVLDGTHLSVAPGSTLGINSAKSGGEITEVHLDQGHMHVSNIEHVHHHTMHVHVGGHVVTLSRAAALISHTQEKPHVTLLEGEHASVLGHDVKIDQPGHRLHLDEAGHSKAVPHPDEVATLLNKVGGAATLRANVPPGRE